jgi:hypothetical protein
MAKKRILKTERGVTLVEEVLFGGEPRRKIDIAYTVRSKRRPEGKTFANKVAATKYYKVQVSFSPPD